MTQISRGAAMKISAGLLAALAMTACGSTVPYGPTVTSQGANGVNGAQSGTGGTTGSLTGGTTGVTGTTGASGPSTTGSVSTGGSSSISGPSAASASTTAATSIPTKGPGWDATYVYVGVMTVKDLHAVASGLGLALDPGDSEGQANAVAAYVNSHGGILGRKLKVLFRDQSTANTASNPDAVGAAACTDFTQDRKVVAVFNWASGLDTENLRTCLAKAGVILLSASSATVDTEATKSLASYYYELATIAWDKLAPVFVSRLQAEGWFVGWNSLTGQPGSALAKTGILTDSTPAGTRVAAQIKSALAAAGHPGALVYQYTDPTQGQASSVQYFNGNHVDHVIVTNLELTAFQNSAASQHYSPRYGITSYNDPYTNLELNSPPNANNGALGIGWAPAYDVSQASDPGSTGRGQKTCIDLMAKGGQTFNGKRTAEALSLDICDGLMLLAAGAKAGRGLTAAAIFDGAIRIAPQFSSAVSFGNAGITATRLFVPGAVRDLAWLTTCKCYRYTSKSSSADI